MQALEQALTQANFPKDVQQGIRLCLQEAQKDSALVGTL